MKNNNGYVLLQWLIEELPLDQWFLKCGTRNPWGTRNLFKGHVSNQQTLK